MKLWPWSTIAALRADRLNLLSDLIVERARAIDLRRQLAEALGRVERLSQENRKFEEVLRLFEFDDLQAMRSLGLRPGDYKGVR